MLRVEQTRGTPAVSRAIEVKQQPGFMFEASATKHCPAVSTGVCVTINLLVDTSEGGGGHD